MELKYNLHKPWETLDPWQQEYLEAEGNCFLLTGRQVGKSTIMSIKAGELAIKKNKQDILVVAYTEKQAYELFMKILNYLEARYHSEILQGKFKPTKHEIRLRNGSIIRCHACGQNGSGLRGYTLTKLFVDEAAPMNSEIFTSILPALSVSGGSFDVSSTPRGKSGFFYNCSLRDDMNKFYVSAVDCPRHNKDFLDSERKNMSELEFCQEYEARFLDELRRIFDDDLIRQSCILRRPESIGHGTFYLGSDIARMGEDLSTFQILKKIDDENIIQVESISTSKQLLTQTTEKIIELDRIYDFRKIGIDDGGAGAGVFDNLIKEERTRRKTEALNNSSKPLDRDGKKKKRVLKEDMYLMLLSYMEKGKIKLLDDEDLILSLKSMQFEYVTKTGKETRFRIFGAFSHHTEGLVRAAWLMAQEKGLNIWVKSI